MFLGMNKCNAGSLILLEYFPIILFKILEKSCMKQVSHFVGNKCKLFEDVFKDSSAHFRLFLVVQTLGFLHPLLLCRTLKASENFIVFVLERHESVVVQV